MEALLKEVQGHLGESLLGTPNNLLLTVTTSYLSHTFLGGRGRSQQFLVQRRSVTSSSHLIEILYALSWTL